MAAWCSWKACWEPVDAGEAAATGPAGRGEMQRSRAEAGNNHSREILVVKASEGWAHRCSGRPSWLETLKRLTVFTHQQSSLGKSLLTN